MKNNKNIILLTFVLSMLLLTSCSKKNDGIVIEENDNITKKETMTETEVESSDDKIASEEKFKYIKNSSLVLGKGLKPLDNSVILDEDFVIDWYSDPFCPSCVMLEEYMQDNLEKLIAKGFTIRFYFLGFKSPQSVDDYSNRASTYILGVTEFAPDLSYKFIKSIMNTEFLPEHTKFTSDDKFKKEFTKIGGTEEQWKQIENNFSELYRQVTFKTNKTFNDSYFIEHAHDGRLTVPYIVIGNSDFNMNFSAAEDVPKFFLQEVDKYLKNINKQSINIKTEQDKKDEVN